MADDFIGFGSQPVQQTHLIGHDQQEFMRILPGGRIFIDGQETSDAERIGARFKEWALFMCPPPLAGTGEKP
jgi:hypothetical protein